MIFRRFLQRFQHQPWGSIATELAIVIIGVFIGMQVSNWNEERETAQKASVFSARLTNDLRREAWAYESLINYSHQTNANQRRVLDAMAGDSELSDEQFVISAYRATQYKDYNRYRATYDELVSTGNIGLVADRTLREAAVALFTTNFIEQITLQVRESEYRRVFRESVSAPVQEALLVRCGDRLAHELDYAAIESELDYPCTLDLPLEKIHAAAIALKGMPRFIPALQVRFADNQTALTDLQKDNEPVLTSLHAIRDGAR